MKQENIMEYPYLRSVYGAARRVLRHNGVNREKFEEALEDLDAAIERVKLLDSGLGEGILFGVWVPCSEQMPAPGIPVIAYVPSFDGGGKYRRLRAQYAPPKTLEMGPECEGGIYDEETDTFYCEEGWYETNVHEEVHWAITDEVTHWMPLPDVPAQTDKVQT